MKSTTPHVNFLYLRALGQLLETQDPLVAPRDMPVKEIVNAHLTLMNPNGCVISLPDRKLNYHFMVAEFWWIACGMNTVSPLDKFCNEISRFSDDGKTFYGAYGPHWNGNLGYVVNKLRSDPDSRQAVLTLWRQSPPQTKDVPCTISMQYLIRDEKLVTIVNMRSSDAWLGLPYDIFNFARLGSIVAGELQVPQGLLHLNLGSLHLYERDFEKAEKLMNAYYCHPDFMDSPELDPLPGMIPQMGSAWMAQASAGHIGTAAEPWVTYLRVLADRVEKNKDLIAYPWKELIHGK